MTTRETLTEATTLDFSTTEGPLCQLHCCSPAALAVPLRPRLHIPPFCTSASHYQYRYPPHVSRGCSCSQPLSCAVPTWPCLRIGTQFAPFLLPRKPAASRHRKNFSSCTLQPVARPPRHRCPPTTLPPNRPHSSRTSSCASKELKDNNRRIQF